MQIHKSLLIFFLGIFLTGALCALWPAYGDKISDLQQQQDDLANQLKDQAQIIKEKSQERKSFISQLNVLENDITQVSQRLSDLEKEVSYTNGLISDLENEIQIEEEKLAERMENFQKRLREIYMTGDTSYLEVLFDSASFNEFVTRYDMMESLLINDQLLLAEIEKKQQELQTTQSELVNQKQLLMRIQDEQQTKQFDLDARKEEKQGLLQKTENEKAVAEKAYDELEALSEQLEAEIREMQLASGSPGEFNGIFTWPTPGYTRISSNYGYRTHPILKTKRFHTGIDIAAPSGTSIVAVEDGTVISSGWYGAYGNMTVVDHGGGISSMYAHQIKILVQKGEKVTRGQVIGKVGSTGWSTGAHLHFEAREDGKHVNPFNYLNK